MKGRKRQPTKLKELNGNVDKRWINKDEPKPEALTILPEPPVKLTKPVRVIWDFYCKYLKELNMLHAIDMHGLVMFCKELGIYYYCMEQVDKMGVVKGFKNGSQEMEQINPFYKAANLAFDRACKLADKFGFNPSARASLKMQGEQPDERDGEDLFRIAK